MEIMDEKEIKLLLEKAANIAIVGLSPKENRPSYMVATYLIKAGYNIIPVNPGQSEILGRKCYPDLTSVPDKIDIVDIFRRSDMVMPVVEEAVSCKAGCIWMQLDIVNEEAAEIARSQNIPVIMNRCIKIDHASLFNN